jgi:hypothetical protein
MINDLIALRCYPATYVVEVDVVFLLPNWTVVSANPDQSTMKQADTWSEYDLSNSLPQIVLPDYDFDATFAALVYGSKPLPMSEFLGESNVPTVTAALNRLYGRFAA